MLGRLRARLRGDDSGMTLVELLVAMGIFTIVLGIFGAGMVTMTRSTARAQVVADATLEGRKAFAMIDKQVRSASAVNRHVLVGGKWYVEFLTDATGAASPGVENPSVCTQWRLDTATDQLQVRTWKVGAAPTAWNTVATDVVNDTANPPFAFAPTKVDAAQGTIYNKQRLLVDLQIKRGSAPVTEISSTLVARNTSLSTPTNLDTNSDGLTDRVCTDQGQP